MNLQVFLYDKVLYSLLLFLKTRKNLESRAIIIICLNFLVFLTNKIFQLKPSPLLAKFFHLANMKRFHWSEE